MRYRLVILSRDRNAEFLGTEPELYGALMSELKQRTSGRWHWDQIEAEESDNRRL